MTVQDEIFIWSVLGSQGVKVRGQAGVHLGVGEGSGPQMPGSVPWGGSHRVEAGLHHRWLGLQPGQVAADEAAQNGDVRAGGTRGGLIPLLRVSGGAMVVAHLEHSWSGWAG